MIAIVDYGMGNLGSVCNMLRKAGAEAVITAEPGVIAAADKLILPGVGAFDTGMQSLDARGLRPVLQERVFEHRVPLLGICLGMQLLTRGSEEGTVPGLGWIDADTRRFAPPAGPADLKVPHMGWNTIDQARPHPLLEGIEEPPRFYFVHSYYITCRHEADVLATCRYGVTFTASLAHDNIMGTQFHPEKSHKFGLRLLSNFAGLN